MRMATKDNVVLVSSPFTYNYTCSIYLTLAFIVQSVSERDDLFPMEGSEDWTTEIQHPTSVSLRELVPLLLSQQAAFEYTIPSHTAQELWSLSENMSRMEFHASFQFKFLDHRAMDKIANYHERYRQQIYGEKHILSKL